MFLSSASQNSLEDTVRQLIHFIQVLYDNPPKIVESLHAVDQTEAR